MNFETLFWNRSTGSTRLLKGFHSTKTRLEIPGVNGAQRAQSSHWKTVLADTLDQNGKNSTKYFKITVWRVGGEKETRHKSSYVSKIIPKPINKKWAIKAAHLPERASSIISISDVAMEDNGQGRIFHRAQGTMEALSKSKINKFITLSGSHCHSYPVRFYNALMTVECYLLSSFLNKFLLLLSLLLLHNYVIR